MVKAAMFYLREYAKNSSICGFRYLVYGTVVERVFWIAALGASCYGTFVVTRSSYESYQKHPMSFAVETDYLHWNTSFPAITVCEGTDRHLVSANNYVKTYFPGYVSYWTATAFINSVVYSVPCLDCEGWCAQNTFCDLDYVKVAMNVTVSCEELISNCAWNGESFNCCSKFRPFLNERGYCYSLNPSHTKAIPPKMISNRQTGPGELYFALTKPGVIYLQGRDDTPHHNIRIDQILPTKKQSSCSMIFTVVDMENDVNIKYESLERRNCKFPNEPVSHRFKRYSYSACVVDCRARKQLELCNCTHPFIPNSVDTTCGIEGLMCIQENRGQLQALRTELDTLPGIYCPCPNSCVESEYEIVYKECIKKKNIKGNYQSEVVIKMASLPVVKLKRSLIRSKLELVVSVGGIVGLFLGASLLSAAEVFMIIFIRPQMSKCKESRKPIPRPSSN